MSGNKRPEYLDDIIFKQFGPWGLFVYMLIIMIVAGACVFLAMTAQF